VSGVLGYLVGHDAGRSDSDVSRQRREIVDRVFYGSRPVQVEQSYLDQIHRQLEEFRANSVHNFEKGEQFYTEALDWKARAQRGETRAEALEAQIAALQSKFAERDVELAKEKAAHQTTNAQKHGLNLFRLIATWLIDAHIAGRSDRSAFTEMCDMAKIITDAIERGETFYGYRDEPEKKAGLQALLEELLRA
jgi:hypothetical protein